MVLPPSAWRASGEVLEDPGKVALVSETKLLGDAGNWAFTIRQQLLSAGPAPAKSIGTGAIPVEALKARPKFDGDMPERPRAFATLTLREIFLIYSVARRRRQCEGPWRTGCIGAVVAEMVANLLHTQANLDEMCRTRVAKTVWTMVLGLNVQSVEPVARANALPKRPTVH